MLAIMLVKYDIAHVSKLQKWFVLMSSMNNKKWNYFKNECVPSFSIVLVCFCI